MKQEGKNPVNSKTGHFKLSSQKRTKKKEIPYNHEKKLMLSCDPLAMNVPFEIYLPFSKPSMLGNTAYEKQKELV